VTNIRYLRSPAILLAMALWIAFDPGWSGLLESRLYLWNGFLTTMLYSIAGGFAGLIAGGAMAALRISGGIAGSAVAGFVGVSQAVPPLFVIIATYLTFPGVFGIAASPEIAGVVSLALIAVDTTARLCVPR
jgi:ABC-type amino acid transport system permease subunit